MPVSERARLLPTTPRRPKESREAWGGTQSRSARAVLRPPRPPTEQLQRGVFPALPAGFSLCLEAQLAASIPWGWDVNSAHLRREPLSECALLPLPLPGVAFPLLAA